MGFALPSKTWIIVLVMIAGVFTASTANNSAISTHEIVQRLLNNYNKLTLPTGEKEGPLEVKVGLHVISVKIDDVQQTAKLVVYFRQSWTDKRLQFTHFNRTKMIMLEKSDLFWKPDTFIRRQTHPAAIDHEFYRISPDGTVRYVQRMFITVSIQGSRKSTFGGVSVPLEIESFAHTMDAFYLSVMHPVEIAESAELTSNTYFSEVVHFDCSENVTSGAYACLSITFHFKRRVSGFVLGVGLPIFLAVALSWCSLWLKLSSTNLIIPRVLIQLAAILLSGFIVSWNHAASAFFVISAGDILTLGSLFIVLASFIETVIVILQTSGDGAGNKDDSSSSIFSQRKADFIAMIAVPVAFVGVVTVTTFY